MTPSYTLLKNNRLWVWLIAITVVILGCQTGQKDKKPGGTKTRGDRSEVADTLFLLRTRVADSKSYGNMLEDLDKNNLRNIDRALRLFSNTTADSLGRDSMLISFNEFMTSVMQSYYDSQILGNTKLADLFGSSEDQAEAQKLVRMLANHGINLLYREGEFYLEPDMGFVYQHLGKTLTSGSRDYLQTRIKLSREFSGIQDKRISAPDSIVTQISAWEDFLERNPGYLLKDAVQTQYLDLLNSYLNGLDQLPLFNPESGMVEPVYKESYARYLQANPQRESAKIVRKFYDLLASKGFKSDEEIDKFLSDLNFNPSQIQQ